MTRLPTPSIPLDPPPPYDSLFATATHLDSAVAPQISQITGATLIYGIQMLGQTGTCSSSPPHPQYLICYNILIPLLKPHTKKDRSKYIITCEYMFLFFQLLEKFLVVDDVSVSCIQNLTV